MASIRHPDIKQVIREQVPQSFRLIPPTADPDWFRVSTVLAAQTTTLLAAGMTKSYAPGHPIVPVLVVVHDVGGDTSWTSIAVTLVGIDQFGVKISETVAAVDNADTWTATALNAYATLISIEFTITGGTAADGNDTYVLGFVKTYGLGVKIGATGDVLISNFDGTTESGTASTVYHTYVIAGTPNTTKILQLYMRSTAY